MDDNLNEVEEGFENYPSLLDIFKNEELFFFNYERPKSLQEYVGLLYLKLVAETMIVQITYAPNVDHIGVLAQNDNVNLNAGLDILGRGSFFAKMPYAKRKKIFDQAVILARASLEKINAALELTAFSFMDIDPELRVQTGIEEDIYLVYLQELGFGLPRLRTRDPYLRDLEIRDVKAFLEYKYTLREIDAALAIDSNLNCARIIALNLGQLGGKWDSIDLICSDYVREVFDSPNAHQHSRVSEEITPWHTFDSISLPSDRLMEIKSLCDSQMRDEGTLTFLFRGPSGVGKTTLAHAIAGYLGKKILRVQASVSENKDVATLVKYFCNQAKNKEFVLLFDEAEGLFNEHNSNPKNGGWANILFEEFKGIAIFTTNYRMPYGFDRRITYTLAMDDLQRGTKTDLIESLCLQHNFIISKQDLEHLGKLPIAPGYFKNIFRLAELRRGHKSDAEVLMESFIQRLGFHLDDDELEQFKIKSKDPEKLIFSDQLKSDLAPLVSGVFDFKSNPFKYPKGIKAIFSGPPGTGKTAFVKSLAQDVGFEFELVSPADVLGMFVGQSEKAVKRIFDADLKRPKIIFLDEADAFFGNRDSAVRSWEVTLSNQLLTSLENYKGIVLAATNRYEFLDPAFKRRFLFNVNFPYPSLEARSAIWLSRAPTLSLSEIEKLAAHELTGADIADICFKGTTFTGVSFENYEKECLEVIRARHPKEKTIGLL